jgi:hypothetical protein
MQAVPANNIEGGLGIRYCTMTRISGMGGGGVGCGGGLVYLDVWASGGVGWGWVGSPEQGIL